MLDRQKQFKITIRITALIPQEVFLLSLLVASQAVIQAWDPWLVWAAPIQLMQSQGSHPCPPALGRGGEGKPHRSPSMAAHRSRPCRTSFSRHLQFLATWHPSQFGLDLAGERVQEWCHRVLSKNGSLAASVNTDPPVHVPDVMLCASAGNCWLPCHSGAMVRVQLGMCYLSCTGCHLYLNPYC